MPNLDPEAQKANQRAHYQAYKHDYKARVAERRRKVREWLEQYKASLKCLHCPENHPACIDLHHRDPSQKDMAISQVIGNWSLARLQREVLKCDPLCANCHRKLHWEEKRQS